MLLGDDLGEVVLHAQDPWRALGHAAGRPGDDDTGKARCRRQALGRARVDLDPIAAPDRGRARPDQVAAPADSVLRSRHRVAGDENAKRRAGHGLSIARAECAVYGPAVRITSVSIQAWDVELLEPFGIATGAQVVARNVLLELELEGGLRGLGEAAPFPAVNGETQADAISALHAVEGELVGQQATDASSLSAAVRE